MTDKDSGLIVCRLGYDAKTDLSQLRRMVKSQTKLVDFVFCYADHVRIHPKQEKHMKVQDFGDRIELLNMPSRSSTGKQS